MERFLSGDLIVGFVILFFFLIVMLRLRKKPGYQPLEWDLAYDYVTEPATTGNEDFRKTFGAVPIPGDENVHLIRLAFLNRGKAHVTLDQFKEPAIIRFPEGTTVLSARFNERFRSSLPAVDDPAVSGQTVTIRPFALEPDGIVIFNLVVEGAAEPETVKAALTEQPEVERLGLKFRFMRPK